MAKALRVDHGPVDPDLTLTKEEKAWLRSWNRHAEIPGESAPEPSGDGDDGGGSEDYDSKNVPELRDLLKDRDLPTAGNKAELVARLEEDDDSDEE